MCDANTLGCSSRHTLLVMLGNAMHIGNCALHMGIQDFVFLIAVIISVKNSIAFSSLSLTSLLSSFPRS